MDNKNKLKYFKYKKIFRLKVYGWGGKKKKKLPKKENKEKKQRR